MANSRLTLALLSQKLQDLKAIGFFLFSRTIVHRVSQTRRSCPLALLDVFCSCVVA